MSSSNSCEKNWRGVPLSDIYGSESPWKVPEYRLISSSENHTAMYGKLNITGQQLFLPIIGDDIWDCNYVRMPCSNQNLVHTDNESDKGKQWDRIVKALSQPMANSKELSQAILSYNSKYKDVWKFKLLHKFFNKYLKPEESLYFFDTTLPQMVKLALSLPMLIRAPIPLLKQYDNHSVSFTQQQISSLLANAFFCTYPRRNTKKQINVEYCTYPHINFSALYESNGSKSSLEKLKCLLNYFKKVCEQTPTGTVTITRCCMDLNKCPDWKDAEDHLTVPLYIDSKTCIEDLDGLIQVDFANKYLGGGVLGQGCVQEEIRFVICPELIVSMLITEMMLPNEAVMIIGCERYSRYSGYSNTFQFQGDFNDNTPYDSSGRRRCAILSIDALPVSRKRKNDQFKVEAITRELNKAWIGFSMYNMDEDAGRLARPGVASGNWGCGAFGGSAPLKALLQLSAAARAARPLALCTFGDTQLRDSLAALHSALTVRHVTVGDLFKHILKFSETDVTKMDVISYLIQIYHEDKLDIVAVQTQKTAEIFENDTEL